MAPIQSTQRNGKGRQKLRMVKMENKSNLQVTFSKRRCGLFKKASELCTLTGAEVGIIVNSPGRKVFSFGHPCVHKIIYRSFPTSNNNNHPRPNNANNERLIEAHTNASVFVLNMHLSTLNLEIEHQRKQNLLLEEKEKAERAQLRWNAPMEKLLVNELEELGMAMEALKAKLMQVGNNVLYGSMFY